MARYCVQGGQRAKTRTDVPADSRAFADLDHDAGTSRSNVSSGMVPKRMGGPHEPVPALT